MLSVIGVLAGVCAGAIQPSVSELTAVEQIFHVIPDLATPEQVQASLREILDDPTLDLFWWDWESERYVDVHDGPGTLATVDAVVPRVATLVEYESRRVGAILHDPRLLERNDFLECLRAGDARRDGA